MENLNIKKTDSSPQIDMNALSGLIDIVGDSYPEDSFVFYENINSWVEEYFKSAQKITKINFELNYINSSSFKVFFDMFVLFDEARKKGNNIEINWIYDEENDVSQEIGEDFILDFKNLNINLIVKH